MANTEIITCDYAGCKEPFAYRIKGFNLCAKHCFDSGEFVRLAAGWYRKTRGEDTEPPNGGGIK